MQHVWEAHPELRQPQIKFYAGWKEGQELVFRPNSNRIHKPHAKPRRTLHKPVAPETRAKQAAVNKAVKAAENKAASQLNRVEEHAKQQAAAQQNKLEEAEAARKATATQHYVIE